MSQESSQKSNSNERVHVISRQSRWAVKKEGKARASKLYDDKQSAIRDARKLKSKGHDVVVHKRDGSIQKWENAEQ